MSMVEVVAEGQGWALLGATSGKKAKGQEKAGLMAEERRYSVLLTVLPQQPHDAVPSPKTFAPTFDRSG